MITILTPTENEEILEIINGLEKEKKRPSYFPIRKIKKVFYQLIGK
jgi:hypothetical protein